MQVRGVDGTGTDQRHSRSVARKFDGRETVMGEEVARGDTGNLLQPEHAEKPGQEELQSTFEQRLGGMRVLGRQCRESR